MAITLANLHILEGDERQIRTLLPNAIIGQWSTQFISVYSQEFLPRLCEKTVKSLSKKLEQPMLLTWIFDSDAVGFTVYQNGRKVTEHTMSLEGNNKMGNIPVFCESLHLPMEDISRLKVIWKKGDAEEQLELTASLLGLPLCNDSKKLPAKQHFRDNEVVDTWIVEHQAPPKIKSESKALLIQELMNFDWNCLHGGTPYCSVESSNNANEDDKYQIWIQNKDGTLRPDWSWKGELCFLDMPGRTFVTNTETGVVVFDSAGLLQEGYIAIGEPHLLSDGGILWEKRMNGGDGENLLFIRCTQDGSELWSVVASENRFFACANGEIYLFPIITISMIPIG